MLDLFPSWTQISPTFAKELLASIQYKCRIDQALDREERDFLVQAITQILAGVPPSKALQLTARTGKRRETLSKRNISIYNHVVKLCNRGYSKNRAFIMVSTLPIAAKRGRDEALSAKGVEKIYAAIEKETAPPKKLAREK